MRSYRYYIAAGWSSPVAREAHNLEVVGSNPAPATYHEKRQSIIRLPFFVRSIQSDASAISRFSISWFSFRERLDLPTNRTIEHESAQTKMLVAIH